MLPAKGNSAANDEPNLTKGNGRDEWTISLDSSIDVYTTSQAKRICETILALIERELG